MEVKETLQALTRGQNGLLDPVALNPDYASRLYNVTIRDGLARTRPGLQGTDMPVQGRFQGAFEYRLENAVYWVVVVSGQVWSLALATQVWTHIGTFPTIDFDQAYFVQADRYAIVQNGIHDPTENWPIIFHGTTLVDNLATEYFSGNSLVKVSDFTGNAGGPSTIRVPIGKSMAYGHGRLFVAVDRYYNDGAAGGTVGWKTGLGLIFWMAGNLIQIGNIPSILVFSDSYILNYGVAFGLPTEAGFITAMGFLRNADTGSGLGALVILARRGAVAFAVNVSREKGSWLSPGFGQSLFTSSGTNSPWAMIPVNSDIVYYGDVGLRTLKYSASSEAGTGGLATTSLSPEVTNFTRLTDNDAHAPFVTATNVDNYVFFTAGGVELVDGSVAFYGVLPWDLANFQVSGEAPSRVFAGAWCGSLIHAVLPYRQAGRTAGAIYRESATGTLKYGAYLPGTADSSVCSVRTAAFTFKSPLNIKIVKSVDVMFDHVDGPVDIWFRWRFEGDTLWNTSLIRKFTGASSATGLVRIATETDTEAAGLAVQFAVEWRGIARLKLAIFNADAVDKFTGSTEDCGRTELAAGSNEDDEFGCPAIPVGVDP